MAADDLTPLVTVGSAEGFAFLSRLARELAQGAFSQEGFVLLGAFGGDTLLGVGGITPDPYAADPSVGRVRHVYVLPEARRRGVARSLLTRLVASAPPQYERLRLRTMTAGGAAFYQAWGFSETDEPDATHTLTRRDTVACTRRDSVAWR